MINLKIKGGLGNQLFQYALARSLAIKNNTSLNVDYSSYNQPGTDTPRQYELNLFNTKVVSNNKSSFFYFVLSFLNKVFNKLGFRRTTYFNQYYFEKGVNFDNKILFLKDNSWLTGFFQSEEYFNNISELIRSELTFKDISSLEKLSVYQEIRKTNAVFIHIRRGDYINNPRYANFYYSCPLDYYKQAIALIEKRVNNPKFFIFSDDADWVRENLMIDNAVFISALKLKDYEDLFLMSQCQHAIIANSSFSWWGAWLINSKDKIIVAPEKWFQNDKIDSSDIIPESWIKL